MALHTRPGRRPAAAVAAAWLLADSVRAQEPTNAVAWKLAQRGMGIYQKKGYIIVLALVAAVLLLVGTLLLLWNAIRTRPVRKRPLRVNFSEVRAALGTPQQIARRLPINRNVPLAALNNFGIYLGDFGSPLGADAMRILTSYQLLVLDPSRRGVLGPLRQHITSKFVLARVDLTPIVEACFPKHVRGGPVGPDAPTPRINTSQTIAFVRQVVAVAVPLIRGAQGHGDLFDGILFHGLETLPHAPIFTEVAAFLRACGVLVFVELQPPTFSSQHLPDMNALHGVLMVNVTIGLDGSRRDYFQMVPHVYRIIKAYTEQQSTREDFAVLICEAVSSQATVSPAQINRLLKFTQFYKAVPWFTVAEGLSVPKYNRPLTRATSALEFMGAIEYQAIRKAWVQHRVEVMTEWSTLPTATANGALVPRRPPGTVSTDPGHYTSAHPALDPRLWRPYFRKIDALIERVPIDVAMPDAGDIETVQAFGDYAYFGAQGSATAPGHINVPGQPEFMRPATREHFDKVVTVQRDLRTRAYLLALAPEKRDAAIKLLEQFRYVVSPHEAETADGLQAHINTLSRSSRVDGEATMPIYDDYGYPDRRVVAWHLTRLLEALKAYVASVALDEKGAPVEPPVLVGADGQALSFALELWQGLDTGFKVEDVHFWSVYEMDSAAPADAVHRPPTLHVYLSQKHPRPAEALLNAWLSAHGYPARSCAVIESWIPSPPDLLPHDTEGLPSHIRLQIEQSTVSEQLLLVHATHAQRDSLDTAVWKETRRRLLDAVEIDHLVARHAVDLLANRVSPREYLRERCAWYKRVVSRDLSSRMAKLVRPPVRGAGSSGPGGHLSHLTAATTTDQETLESESASELDASALSSQASRVGRGPLGMAGSFGTGFGDDGTARDSSYSVEGSMSDLTSMSGSPFADVSVKSLSFRLDSLVELWEEVQWVVRHGFFNNADYMRQIVALFAQIYATSTRVEASTDLLACMFFAACKRQAYEEVFFVTCDFNPLPAREPDQQALMSELYILGSRCTEFFDVAIDKIGQVMYDERFDYLQANPPPLEGYHPRKFMFTYLPLLHSGDMAPRKSHSRKVGRDISAAFVFAIPSVLDLLLLMITGHGIFVNTSMTRVEQQYVSMGLLISLLIAGGMSPSISTAGSYYLYLYQFPSMAVMMLQQLSAGLITSIFVALIGGFIVMFSNSYYKGLIFFLYLIVYPIYLLCLGTLASIYNDGISVTSGRTAVYQILPVAIVYWIFSFVVPLGNYQLMTHAIFWGLYALLWLYKTRLVLTFFSGWLHKVVQTNEKAIGDWYQTKYGAFTEDQLMNKKNNWLDEIARRRLVKEVDAERARWFRWFKGIPLPGTSVRLLAPSRRDPFVQKLADAFGVTQYLLNWHSIHLDYDVSRPYGLEWNLNVKLAIQDMQKLNKASKLNRTRLMWAWSKNEMGFGFLYFFLLLLDRWVVLFTGGDLLSLIAVNSPQGGFGAGAALLYFLFANVAMEIIARGIWREINNLPEALLHNREELRPTLIKRMAFQRQMYFSNLGLFAGVCAWIWVLCALFLWVTATQMQTVIIFFIMTFGYTGLLWAVYSKIFISNTSSAAVTAMFVGVVVGFAMGIPLRNMMPNSKYLLEQVSACVGMWIAAIIAWRGVIWNYREDHDLLDRPNLTTGQHCIGVGPALPADDRDRLIRGKLRRKAVLIAPEGEAGRPIAALLQQAGAPAGSELALAFPDAATHMTTLVQRWCEDHIRVYVVPDLALVLGEGRGYAALPILNGQGGLALYVGIHLTIQTGQSITEQIARDPTSVRRIAEALVHEAFELLFGYAHHEACAAELLLDGPHDPRRVLPARMAAQIYRLSSRELTSLVFNTRQQVVKHLALNIPVDLCWEQLTPALRTYLVERMQGRAELTRDVVTSLADLHPTRSVEQLSATSELTSRIALMVDAETRSRLAHGVPYVKPTFLDSEWSWVADLSERRPSFLRRLAYWLNQTGRFWYSLISSDVYIPREIELAHRHRSPLIHYPIVLVTTTLARLYRTLFLSLVENMLWVNRPMLHVLKNTSSRAIRRVVTDHHIQLHNPLAPETAILESAVPLVFHHYKGIITKKPFSRKLLTLISEYSTDQILLRQQVWKNLEVKENIVFHYAERSHAIPERKDVVSTDGFFQDVYFYDPHHGHVTRGLSRRRGITFHVEFLYQEPVHHQELLEIRYVSDHVVISTFWYTTQKRRIIPTSMIQRVVMTAREGVFETTWDYALKRHPVLRTMHHGVEVETPTVIAKDSYRILGRPTRLFFQLENLLYYERRDIAIPYHRPFKFSTRKARTALWKVWFSTDQVDGVYARMLDEHLLRQEPLLRPYWRHRDAGRIKAAIRHLEKHEDQIAAAIYIDDDISSKSHVAFKLADLYMMGMGGDSYVTSLRPQITFPITPEKLHVLGLDTGTWPSSSGGVSNCIAAGTPVAVGRGDAAAIETVAVGDRVQAFDAAKNGLVPSLVSHRLDQGVRACVELTFSDGRTLVCTPDHRLLRGDGTWVEAKDMIGQTVQCAPIAPLRTIEAAEAAWTLAAGDHTYTVDSPTNIKATLTFARLAGYTLADASTAAMVTVGHVLDAHDIQAAIELLAGVSVKATTPLPRGRLQLALPPALAQQIDASGLPARLMAADCPRAVQAEFFAGLFGRGGHAPALTPTGGLTGVTFTASLPSKNANALVSSTNRMCDVLRERFHLAAHTEAPSPAAASPSASETMTVVLVIAETDTHTFESAIGFGFAVDKQQRLAVAASWHRMCETAATQYAGMVDRVEALTAAQVPVSAAWTRVCDEIGPTLVAPGLLRVVDGAAADLRRADLARFVPSAKEWIATTGMLSSFQQDERGMAAEDASELDAASPYEVVYGVRDSRLDAMATYRLRVLFAKPVGPRPVWDLSVDLAHVSFVAAGVVVHNCVKDMVDNLASIRWNILAENAHDMELILSQFQIEYNVNTVCMLPLWGYDWLDACHGLMGAKTDLEMEDKETRSDDRAVTNMIDILRRLIHYCHIRDLRATDLEAASRVFVDYYDFFQIYDYNAIWNHPRVRLAWMEMWMDRMPDNLLDLEAATVTSLLNTMDYMRRCMCCLAVTLPDDPPDVVQASHHATGSIVGLVLKLKKGVALHVWDHGILWREYLGHWSGAESKYRPSLHNMMIMMVRLIASLSLYNADVILPCTSISNPEWEVIRGSNNGTIDHRNQTLRRIDPMTNGISDMTDFEPDFTAELPDPTAVMLSHIVTFKDIKNAVLAADVIVNQFGIKRYFLDIYGSTDKLPWYTYECQTLITTLGLQDNVKIRGFGDSKYVLNSAWLVLNSSISEGLPLALGEAGLSGQPIVCTEAGGSREIIQGPGNHLYGRNVSPGSPYELALGQLAVLGLFDGLEDVANGRDPDPNADKLVDWISARRFADISERIMAKRLERRKLGLALRAHVLKKFSGTRYLREHEQMLWIGAHMTKEYQAVNSIWDIRRKPVSATD